MAAPSARRSLRFALQREFLKLYAVTFLGVALLIEAPRAFDVIRHAGVRDLVVLVFTFLGVVLVASGSVGAIYRVQNSRQDG